MHAFLGVSLVSLPSTSPGEDLTLNVPAPWHITTVKLVLTECLPTKFLGHALQQSDAQTVHHLLHTLHYIASVCRWNTAPAYAKLPAMQATKLAQSRQNSDCGKVDTWSKASTNMHGSEACQKVLFLAIVQAILSDGETISTRNQDLQSTTCWARL